MIDPHELLQRTQEQAVAAGLGQLNQHRLDRLSSSLGGQDVNLDDALASIDEALQTIDLSVISTNRGGLKGMHGFIAEVAEVGIANARSQIVGGGAHSCWINDNGPADIIRDGIGIQQKFYASKGRFGLDAIASHLKKYPDFVEQGGRYQLPRDHYATVRRLHDMSQEEAAHLTRSGDGPSLRDWTRVKEFFAEGAIDFDSLEPSTLDYHEVQRGSYRSTLQVEKDSLRSTDQMRRVDAYNAARPNLRECGKAAFTASAFEGGTAFVLEVAHRLRGGRKLKEFDADDWTHIATVTGSGLVSGGIRGVTIYSLTNFTTTPPLVAGAMVTAAFGIAEQASRLRQGKISELEFIQNAEIIALQSAVGALSAFIGQALVPVPILGAVIGSAVGLLMLSVASSALSEREAELIAKFCEDQRELDARLEADYQNLIDQLTVSMAAYLGLLERAFSPDVEAALLGSIDLALLLGVDADEVLDSQEKINAYFLD